MKRPLQDSRSRNASPNSRLCLRVEQARKNTIVNPLWRFLVEEPDADSRFARLAQQMSSRHVDLGAFRAELLDKLRRVPYSQPRDPQRCKYTFLDRMKKAGVLRFFLGTSTLRQIWDWLLVREIICEDRKLENDRFSVERYPLRFHAAMVTEFSRHEDAIAKIHAKYRVEEHWLGEYLSTVDQEKMQQLRTLCLSRWPGSRGDLLGKNRDEELAVQIGIFGLLKHLLPRSLPDRYVRRLTQLICAGPDVNEISNERDEALRVALARRRPVQTDRFSKCISDIVYAF